MIPPVVYHFESNAEKKIFELFNKFEMKNATVFHSLNLPEHEYKQWGEADFVVLSPRGVLVLEVKGGRVSCRDGIWTFTNRYDQETKKSEGPYQQAKSARVALQTRLEGILQQSLIKKINFGFGVMFPDLIFSSVGVEIPTQAIFDAKNWDRKDLVRWIEKLYSFWSEQTGKSTHLTTAEIKIICDAIRPKLELVPALISRVGTSYEKLVQLTKEQYRYLDIMLVQERVVIEGGAGTGKTFLAVEAAKRMASLKKRVLFLCRSPVFSWVIQDRLHNTFVEVMNFEALKEKVKSNTLIDFDVLIIDEGQDFLDMDSISLIDEICSGGLENAHWFFFMDRNNQGSVYGKYDVDSLSYLRSAGIPFPLHYNCRNTKQISLQTMLYTGGDIGECVVEADGLPVDDNNSYKTRDELVEKVNDVLSNWVDIEGVSPGHITVLSPLSFDESIVSDLDKRWRRKFFVIDCNFGNQWHDSMLTFSSVSDFKGLENRYVMLVDLEGFTNTEKGLSMLYVAMTRANSYLWMAVPESIKNIINELRTKHTLKLMEMGTGESTQ